MAEMHPFAPVVDQDCHTLILGSFPSVRSRQQGFYYGHPQNRFWKLLAAVYQENVPQSIPEKQTLLLRHHLALWDVIASCDIVGSSDASVRHAVPVEVEQITSKARIERVICNGSLSGKLYARYLQPRTGLAAIVLPSTSPANAAWSLERLTDVWGAVLLSSSHKA